MPGVIGVASNLIRRDKRYLKLYDYLLGSTIIVDNIESALNFSNAINYSAKVVTLDGDVISTDKTISGGTINTEMHFFTRKRELNELSVALDIMIDKYKLQEKK